MYNIQSNIPSPMESDIAVKTSFSCLNRLYRSALNTMILFSKVPMLNEPTFYPDDLDFALKVKNNYDDIGHLRWWWWHLYSL